MLSVFANIKIDDPERLERLKDSYFSFSTLSDNWVVNINGKLSREAISFLKDELGERMTLFNLLNDDRGWITNALQMMPAVRHDYLLLWNEDHMNMLSAEKTRAVVDEVIHDRVDYMHYGHYEHWRRKFDRVRESGIIKIGTTIDVADITKENIRLFFPVQKRECLVSSSGIFRKEYLTSIMERERTKLPFLLTRTIRRLIALVSHLKRDLNQKRFFDILNGALFSYKLPRFPKQTPFELEIAQDRLYILPMRVASPHEEFFACVDDDVYKDGSMSGYQLIKRGLYPVRSLLTLEKNTPSDMRMLYKISLKKGEILTDRYYIDQTRTRELLRGVLVATDGIGLQSGREKRAVRPFQPVRFYPNISHTVTALGDVLLEVYTSAPLGARIIHPGKQTYSYSRVDSQKE